MIALPACLPMVVVDARTIGIAALSSIEAGQSTVDTARWPPPPDRAGRRSKFSSAPEIEQAIFVNVNLRGTK